MQNIDPNLERYNQSPAYIPTQLNNQNRGSFDYQSRGARGQPQLPPRYSRQLDKRGSLQPARSQQNLHPNNRYDTGGEDGSRKGDKDQYVDIGPAGILTKAKSIDKHVANPSVAQIAFQPQQAYADDKGKNILALKEEIEQQFTQGMSRLYDEEQMALQKLNAIQRLIGIEE